MSIFTDYEKGKPVKFHCFRGSKNGRGGFVRGNWKPPFSFPTAPDSIKPSQQMYEINKNSCKIYFESGDQYKRSQSCILFSIGAMLRLLL